MGDYVEPLKRPYDFRGLIEAYVYTKRGDFVHEDFKVYYTGLLHALEKLFGIQLSGDVLSFKQRILWQLFENTVSSLLRVTSPWDNYLEAGLLHKTLDESGEPGLTVDRASTMIHDANKTSQAAHRNMLYGLFEAIFGQSQRVVISEELAEAGFDDSKEPDITNYYDYM